jgi:hypothetical protein
MYCNKQKKNKNKLLKECKASWWVGVFVLFTYMLAMKTSHDKGEKIAQMAEQLRMLNEDKTLALMNRDRLLCEIESQTDPLWIEMILMQKLGVIPEGQTKVRFKKEREDSY